jgi:hypothetical protein
MTRTAKLALLITAACAACVIAACGVALALRDWVPGLAGCPDPTKPPKSAIFTDPIQIEQRYPQLKPIQSVHWQVREARPRSCPEIGPMDYVTDGLAVLTPAQVAALPAVAGTAPPLDIPDDLRPFTPPGPQWRSIGAELWLDPPSATVYFRHVTT